MNEEDFLRKLGKKIDKLIDKEFDRFGIDRAYYAFHLDVDILNDEFNKIREYTLIDDNDFAFCKFCRAKTYYYSDELQGYICPACLRAYKNSRK